MEDFSFLVLEIDDTPLVREVLGKGFYPVGIGFCVGFFELFLDDLVIGVFIDKDFEEFEGSSGISRGSVLAYPMNNFLGWGVISSREGWCLMYLS